MECPERPGIEESLLKQFHMFDEALKNHNSFERELLENSPPNIKNPSLYDGQIQLLEK